MLTVENAPNKQFKNLTDMMEYLVNNQIITEFGELSESEITPALKEKILKAKKLPLESLKNI